MVPLLPVANPEGVTPGFAERFSALHAELVNTILSELSCNPDMPRETQQSLLAQLQTSISHTKQPAANAWRTFGVGGAPRLLAISGEDPHPHHPHRQPHVTEVRQLSSIRGDICVGGQLGDPSSGLVKPEDQYPAGPALDEDSVSFRALTRLFRDPQALGHLTESASEGSSENTRHKSLAAGVKVKLRHLLLRQNKFTNRFEGSSFARHAEITYASEVTRTQLPSLKRRLAFFAFLLPTISLAHAPRRMDSGLIILQQGLSIIAPAVLLLAAAWICSRREVQSCWRWVVVAAILLADSCNICSDALIPFDNFTPRDKDFHLLWELARFLVMLCACSMASLCGLNFSHVLVLFGAHFLVYVSASTSLYVVWWHASGQGQWVWEVHDTALESRFGGINELNHSCTWLSAHLAGSDSSASTHSPILLDCLVLAFIASCTNVLALKRLNRSDRISFISSFALQAMVTEQTQLLSGERIELLAIFSNPSLRHVSANLGPHLTKAGGSAHLQLGRELKSLLRSVPSPYVFVEPAATLEDVRSAVEEHNPQIAIFSGHSLVGSLVLELPDGSVDLPSEGDFIDALVLGARPNARKKLRCVVLNGCETISLARSIVGRCQNLQVVCWQSITDDSAARAFMIGFYRTVGADLMQDTVVNVEAAYRAGLASFEEQGFVLGDPSPHLHPPEHEHIAAPRYGECQGCSPPVHGQLALVSCKDGRLHVQTGHGAATTYGLGAEAL